MNHYLASGPYPCPQNAPSYMKNSVQLIEVSPGPFSLSTAVLTLPCGHGAAVRHSDAVRQVGSK